MKSSRKPTPASKPTMNRRLSDRIRALVGRIGELESTVRNLVNVADQSTRTFVMVNTLMHLLDQKGVIDFEEYEKARDELVTEFEQRVAAEKMKEETEEEAPPPLTGAEIDEAVAKQPVA